ncbi:MAG: hypothetical protein N3C12_12740 [Candidatus Binatia bacterium]|nr:hypothetical protein [Candidatus Binatia bacterium]
MTARLTIRMRHFAIVPVALWVIMVSAAQDGDSLPRWFAFESATVELQGIIKIEFHFGPPNFGENPKTDQRLHIPIL